MNTIKFNKLYIFGIVTFFSAILFILFGLVTYFAEIFLSENFFLFFLFERNLMILIFVITATLLFLFSNFIFFQEYNKIFKKKDFDNDALNKNKNLNDDNFSNVITYLKEVENLQKNTRQNVFNLMLDTNGINSPDDMQSALEKIENSLDYLKKILDELEEKNNKV